MRGVKGILAEGGSLATVLAAILANLSKDLDDPIRIDAYNRSLMPPDPAGTSKRREDYETGADHASGEPPFVYWNAEREFRYTLARFEFDARFDTRIDNLYYCTRCAGVFVLGEWDFAPINKIEDSFLYLNPYRYPSTSEHDFCEIQAGTWVAERPLFSSPPYWRCLIAMAYGQSGIYVAYKLIWKEGKNAHATHYNRNDYVGRVIDCPGRNCGLCQSKYQHMVSELQGMGWVQQGQENLLSKGSLWYKARFLLPHNTKIVRRSFSSLQGES